MHSFHYRNGSLFCEDVDLAKLAETHGTPLYVYSAGTIRDHYRRLHGSLAPLDHRICYAVKANSNLAVLRLLAREGAGFDIVSGGELFRVLKAGADASRCSFAGVGKTRDEIAFALREGVHNFNVESESELRYIDDVAGELGVIAPVAVRVNPNVDAKTHKYISTGKSENKFGIDFERITQTYARAAEMKNIRIRGIQMHIGSQLTDVSPFVEAVKKAAPLVEELRDRFGLEFFSIGGGIGIVYKESLPSGDAAWWEARDEEARPLTLQRYAGELIPLLEPLGLRIFLEPGRFMVGNAGVLLTRILYEKEGVARKFKIIDSGMNDLIRPALYQGHHDIVPLREPADRAPETVDVVGPICETGDFFARDRSLPETEAGELLAVMSAGAYAFVMASNYNTRPFPAEVLVDGSESALVRKRQTLEEVIAGETIPASLA